MLLAAADLPEVVPGRSCVPYAGAAAARLAGLLIGTAELVRDDGRHTIEWLAGELVARGVDARRVLVPRGEALAHTPVILVTRPADDLHAVLVEAVRGPIAWTLDGGRCARLVDDLAAELVEDVFAVDAADVGNLIPELIAGDRALVRGCEAIRVYGAFGREES